MNVSKFIKSAYEVGSIIVGVLVMVVLFGLVLAVVAGSVAALFVGWAFILGVSDPYQLAAVLRSASVVGVFIALVVIGIVVKAIWG